MSRPSVYNAEEHPAVAEKLATKGATITEIAEVVGVTGTTIKNWMQAHPVFLAAIKAGREAAVDRVERALFERAIGYSWPSEKIVTVSDGSGAGSHVERVPITEHVPPDPAALKFFLTNRRRREWAERQQIEGNAGAPIRIEVVRRADAPGCLQPQVMREDGPE